MRPARRRRSGPGRGTSGGTTCGKSMRSAALVEAAVGDRRRPGGRVRSADLRPGHDDRGGVRTRQARRGVRLHQRARLPPAAGHLRPDRPGVVLSAAWWERGIGPGGEELPHRDREPGAERRRDRAADDARGCGVLCQGGVDHSPQARRAVLGHRAAGREDPGGDRGDPRAVVDPDPILAVHARGLRRRCRRDPLHPVSPARRPR
jgi:hypothetical protein